ncbi:aspartate aminotransferase family protein [Clostridium cylindrosporum]|uniref:Acetylornithine aminotransferase n=1 Tax=Clostridium cylindrosporum DSM 605 TaxID=1121307 RepID=A0A0J8DEP4_CLOCY|nr:aspartate aminotransferase family protein [Clostridium cylindrosporum]KMT22658.1 acetylornithine aminotransferase ArgD [Clostridium cylindrosporum DSM 605]
MENGLLTNNYKRFDLTFVSGKGPYLYTDKGEKYLDFVSGIAVNCLGHSSDIIKNALTAQAEKLVHISNLYWSDVQTDLARKLTELSSLSSVFFCNSGTESIEAALKFARKYGKSFGNNSKSNIVFMKNSFHGRTMGALSVTGQGKYQEAFAPLIGGVIESEFNNIEDIKNKINEDTCAVILEPIQGEGGIISIDKDFLLEVKTLCDKYNALLIFDEVQCGIARTGTFFTFESFGITPDILCLAKGLGGGFPIGATVVSSKVAEKLEPGDHGSTFGGNPLACAVSMAIINEILDKNIIKEVNEKANYIVDKLNKIKENNSAIKDIKGMGLLIGIEVENPSDVVSKALENKLLLVGAGSTVVRLLPPLNVTYEEIDEALSILEKCL